MHQHPSNILALDVGERRIGVAEANLHARFANPLTTLLVKDSTLEDIHNLVVEHGARALVIGLPRGLDGQHTKQTAVVEEFKASLERVVNVPVYWQDEALTSRQAESELISRGRAYKKEDIDALSATIILEDFMRDHPELS